MAGLKLVLAAAALMVAGSLGASALPAGAVQRAVVEAAGPSAAMPVRSRRAAWCFRRCMAGGRPSCRRADSVETCCHLRCDRRYR